MIKKPFIQLVSLFAVTLMLVPAALTAQESPPPLAEMWILHPKPDHGDEFRTALEEHMAFRGEHGDPRAWQSYTPVLGDEMNRVAIRFCCIAWADVDAYREWSMGAEAVGAHFEEHVAPHVARAEHYFESIDWDNSHWNEAGGPYRVFAVTEFHVKPGHRAEFDATLEKMSQIALDQGWATDSRSWLWASRIGGSPQASIVVPHRNYASFDQGEDTFFRFLSEKMGSEDKAAEVFQQFSGALSDSDFQIWVHRENLSMAEDE
jgi:hypothetical protein